MLLTVMHTFLGNGPNLTDWSKWFRITLQSCFCNLLTLNWEVSVGRSLYSFISFIEITQKVVLSWYIENIKTILRTGKHTLSVFEWYFEEIVGKNLFRCFIYVFGSICCISCHINHLCCGLLSRTFRDNGPKLAHWSKWICITLRSCFGSLL